MESEKMFLTIRETARRGPLTEYTLRTMLKQGKLPGIYSGTRFLVNYKRFIEIIDKASLENVHFPEG